MVNRGNIFSFLNYNYTPFSRKQCLIRILLIWILSLLCLIGKFSLILMCILLFFNIVISTVFSVLIIRFSNTKISRYLCDGLFCLYIAIILNISSYKALTLIITINWILSLIFLALLILCVCVFLVLVFYYIKSDKYNIQSKTKKSLIFPFLGAGIGLISAKFFLKDIASDNAVFLVSMILLLLSFIISIGSLNLLKAFLIIYLKKLDNDIIDS